MHQNRLSHKLELAKNNMKIWKIEHKISNFLDVYARSSTITMDREKSADSFRFWALIMKLHNFGLSYMAFELEKLTHFFVILTPISHKSWEKIWALQLVSLDIQNLSQNLIFLRYLELLICISLEKKNQEKRHANREEREIWVVRAYV